MPFLSRVAQKYRESSSVKQGDSAGGMKETHRRMFFISESIPSLSLNTANTCRSLYFRDMTRFLLRECFEGTGDTELYAKEIVSKQFESNKQENNINVNVAKLVSYETNPNSAVKELYRRQ